MYCYAQPANLRTSTVFVLINYNRELKLIGPFHPTLNGPSRPTLTPLTSLSIVVEKYIEIYGHNIIFYISCLLYLFLIISRPHSEHLLFFCKIAPVYSIQIDLNSSAHKSSAACKSYNRTMIKKDLSYCA